MVTTNEFLEHHGIKGMRWGVRKRSTASGPATAHPSKPHAKDLSDEDLKKAIDRMDLEKKYSALINPKRDHSESTAFLKELGKNTVKTAVSAVATQQINKILKK